MLSKKLINELKQIYKQEFGKDLADSEAEDTVRRFVGFFELLILIDQRNKRRRLENGQSSVSST